MERLEEGGIWSDVESGDRARQLQRQVRTSTCVIGAEGERGAGQGGAQGVFPLYLSVSYFQSCCHPQLPVLSMAPGPQPLCWAPGIPHCPAPAFTQGGQDRVQAEKEVERVQAVSRASGTCGRRAGW
jgi:hypothetical protein